VAQDIMAQSGSASDILKNDMIKSSLDQILKEPAEKVVQNILAFSKSI